MFSRVLAISALALSMGSILAVAIPNPSAAGLLPGLPGLPGLGGSTGTSTISIKPQPTAVAPSQCSTGGLKCCNTVHKASDASTNALLGLLGVVVQGVDALVGVNCSPISLVAVLSGNACSANAVCCQDNSFGSLVSIGCVPLNL